MRARIETTLTFRIEDLPSTPKAGRIHSGKVLVYQAAGAMQHFTGVTNAAPRVVHEREAS